MDTLKIILSKANSIRFAHKNGLMATFDNRLSSEESWFNKPTGLFEHTFFKDDIVLIQIKAGLTATVVLTKYEDSGSSILTATTINTYTDFKIYEYVIILKVEQFYLDATSEESTWRSECINAILEDDKYMLLQWSNNDPLTDSFEFDYTTTLSDTYVNFMRIRGQMLNYAPKGDSNIYDNQNEKVKLKSIIYRMLTFDSEVIPRQVAEVIVIAMQHDLFLANEVGYISEDLPEVNIMGGMAQVKAELTLIDSLGLNTHDIGYS